MLPPSVPRFWICAAPIVAAASTSAGRCSRQSADRRISVYVVRAPRTSAAGLERDAPQRVDPRQVEHPLGDRPELAGDRDHDVRAAGDRAGRARREALVRLEQVPGRVDRRLGRHRLALATRCRRRRSRIRPARSAKPPRIWRGVNAISRPDEARHRATPRRPSSISSSWSSSSLAAAAAASSSVDRPRPACGRSTQASTCATAAIASTIFV